MLADSEVKVCYYDKVCFELSTDTFNVTDTINNRQLSEYDLVVLKGAMPSSSFAYSICRYLMHSNTPYFNDFSAYRGINKLAQLIDMFMLNLPIPKTIYVQDHKTLTSLVTGNWKFPFVIKAINASKGKSNFLVLSESELQKILKDHPNQRFMAEEYIPNDCDYRILIIGGGELILRRRASDKTYLNNASQGASIEVINPMYLPKTIRTQARELVQHMNLAISGVDVVQDARTGSFYFLEVNTQPAIGQPEAQGLIRTLLLEAIHNPEK